MRVRHLLAPAALVILWIRQLRFERRLANRQGFWEREAERGVSHAFEQQMGANEQVLKRWHRSIEEALR